MISLEEGGRDYSLRITFTIGRNNAFRGFFPIFIGTKKALMHSYLQYHRLAIFSGAFFEIYAALLVSLGLFRLSDASYRCSGDCNHHSSAIVRHF